jgi:hypothetical protein
MIFQASVLENLAESQEMTPQWIAGKTHFLNFGV